MKKRITSVLLVLALCLTLLPTAALAADHTHSNEAEKLWMETKDGKPTLMKGEVPWDTEQATLVGSGPTGYVLKNGTYYLGDNLTLKDHYIIIEGTVTLCLNGHTIKTENTSLDYAILLAQIGDSYKSTTAANLTLTDCSTNPDKPGTISGGKAAAVCMRSNCTLDMSGGTITGSSKGVDVDDGCTFNMSGGAITGNKGFGVNMVAGTFNMSGGTITGNGNGVHVNNDSRFPSTFNVNGAPTITNNGKDGTTKNVYLREGQTIHVTGEFTGTIGVTAEKPSAGTSIVTEEAGGSIAENSLEYDNGTYEIDKSGKIKAHNWNYTQSNTETNTITATCKDCRVSGDSVTIKAPAEDTLTYNGKAKRAKLTLSDNWLGTNVDKIEIKYSKCSNGVYRPNNTVPTDAGDYKAQIELGGVEASVYYTIEKATLTAGDFNFKAPNNLIYNGKAKDLSNLFELKNSFTGLGETTLHYYLENGESDEVTPCNAGTYTVKISVTEGTNFKATTGDLTDANWKFTIKKATPTISVAEQQITKGSTVDISSWASFNNTDSGAALTYALVGAPTGIKLDGTKLTAVNEESTASTFKIKVSAVATDNFNSPKEETITVTVKREPTKIAAPKAVSGLIYDGTPRTGVTAGEGYELADNTATDAGSYTATATLKEGYKWDDGTTAPKTIAWSIAQKTPVAEDFVMTLPTGTEKPTGGVTLVYNGEERRATANLKDGLTGCDFEIQYRCDENLEDPYGVPKNVGDYIVTILVKETSTNFTAKEILGTSWGITIEKADMTGITATDFNGGYDGNEHTITVTGAPEGTTIRYNSVDTPVIGYDSKYWGFSKLGYTNAGNYTVYYRVYGDNYKTFGGSAAINITKAFPKAPTGLRGTQGQPLSTVKLPEGWTWDAPNTVMDTLGEQIFKASYAADTTGNYEDDSNVGVTVTVTDKETVTISGLTYTGKTYDGKAIAPAGTLTVEGGKVPAKELEVLYESTDGKGYSKTEAPKDAGTYKVTYKVADSNERYIGSVTYDFIISPKAVTAAPANKTMTKGSAIPAFELTYKGLVTGDTLTPSKTPEFSCFEKDNVAVSTSTAAGTYTITWTNMEGTTFDNGNYAVTTSATGTLTISNRSTGGGGGGSSSGGSSGSSSSDRDSHDSNPVIKTETKNHADGSTTKTETRRDGSVTQTTTGKDGGVSKTETKKDGSSVTENKNANGSTGTVKTDKNGRTEAKTKLSDKAIEDAKKNGEAVKAPVEVKASRNSNTAPTVKVELPKNSGETKVEIPVSNVKSGTVAVLVHADGTEEILKNSVPTEGGIRLTVDGSATVKIVDNSKDFIDTRNHWAREEIDFVSARELVNGMSDSIYAPNNSTTRAQLWTILARQEDADLNGGNTWYEKAQLWSKNKGISDGTEPNAAINRAQMVTMLWRAVGQPAAGGTANFTDVPADSYYASAVAWAVENGITDGVGDGRFDPAATCTRAQIAVFLARSMK